MKKTFSLKKSAQTRLKRKKGGETPYYLIPRLVLAGIVVVNGSARERTRNGKR